MNAGGDPTPGERGAFSLLASMTHTRLELAALDIEAHVAATLKAIATGVVALVLGLIALGFVGIAVIALFWDTHRVVATLATTFGYITLAGAMALTARARWNSRPPALAATLEELKLDREAFKGLL